MCTILITVSGGFVTMLLSH